MPPGGDELASHHERLSLEREVLRAVYRSVSPGGVALREAVIRRLANYRFHEPIHQVIFDVLCEIRSLFSANTSAAREAMHEQLLQRLTRKGFPDVDLESILQLGFQPGIPPGSVTPDDLQRIVLRLTSANHGAPNRDER